MTKLDRTVRAGIRELERHVEKKIRQATKNGTLRMWRGRKVVSLGKWEKIQYDFKHVFEYIPDDFIEHSMIYNWQLGEEFDRKRNAWYKDYIEYLEYKKNPALGKYKCEKCILNSFSKTKTTSIRDLLVKHFVNKKISFPCKTVNIFECPYEQGNKDYSLLFLGRIWKILDDALNFAYHRTTYDNKKFIEVDFEKDSAVEYGPMLVPAPNTDTVANSIRDLRLSQVWVEEIKDIFDIITNRKNLDVLLEQYIEYVASNSMYSNERTKESEQEAASLRKVKNGIISFFMKIKNKIRIEDLRGIYDETLEDEEKERQRMVKVNEYLKKDDPVWFETTKNMIRSGKCISCEGFANIHCINCDVWICDKHWKEHGISQHNMRIETQTVQI